MKTWEPDQTFSKADFPIREKKDGEKASGDARGIPGQPSGKPSRTPAKAPGTPGQPAPKKSTERKPNQELKAGGALGSSAWQPEKISGDSSKIVRSAAREAKKTRERQKADIAFPVRLLREAVLAAPESSLHLLRRWYWEKRPPASERIGIKSVDPRDRIQIVLSSLGERITRYLFEIMSPTERAQLNELLKRPARFTEAQIVFVCREFMNSIRERS